MLATKDIGTVTEEIEETIEDRYNRCSLLNVIQHIDIYGKSRSTYTEPTVPTSSSMVVTSVSSGSRSGACAAVSEKISKLSARTRVSGLYPGHDILSRARRRRRRREG